MFRIGICDDDSKARALLHGHCDKVMKKSQLEYEIVEFSAADLLLSKLDEDKEFTIELMFLDIEMPGMDGLHLRDRLIHMQQVWRIVFVSSHEESIMEAFGLKTIGFIRKPAREDEVEKKMGFVLAELNEKLYVELPISQSEKKLYRLDQIAYFEADGNYTKLFLYDEQRGKLNYNLLSYKLGEIEQLCEGTNMIRIHKSFVVNLTNVMSVREKVQLCDTEDQLPIGRKYKEQVKDVYMNFVLKKAKERF